MEERNDMWPMPRETLLRSLEYAKGSLNYDAAKPVEDHLRYIFGLSSNAEAYELIDSIRAHFKEKDEALRMEAYREQARKDDEAYRKFRERHLLYLYEEQEARAIVWITKQEVWKYRNDWGAIFRVLVDKCNWPPKKEEFEGRIKRLKDLGLLRDISPEAEYDYQAMNGGRKGEGWPATYDGWMAKHDPDTVLKHRREVARTLFCYMKNLEKEGYAD